MTREELDLLTNTRDFTKAFYMILRCKTSGRFVVSSGCLLQEVNEWLESSIKSDLGMQLAIWSLYLALHDFAFFKHSF